MALQTVNQFDIGTKFSNLGTGFAQGQLGKERQAASARTGTEFEQEQSQLRASTINKLAINLSQLPLEQRAAALAQSGDILRSVNVDPTVFEGGDLSDATLGEVIAGTGGAQQAQAGKGFTLGQGQIRFDSAGNVIAEGGEKPPALTSLQKNAAALGLKPGTPEYNDFITKGATKPLIVQKSQTAEDIGLADVRVDRFSKVQDTADNASKLIENLNQLDAIDVKKGALEPIKASFAAIAEGFGIKDASFIANATNAQAFNAVSGRLVNEVLNAATGPQTDQDATRARKTIASLGDTPLAAQFKNDAMRAVAFRQMDQRDFIVDRLEKGDNLTKANKSWRDFKNKTPSLSSVVKGPNGLPMFFYQFKETSKQRRPGITDEEIITIWRGAHAKK